MPADTYAPMVAPVAAADAVCGVLLVVTAAEDVAKRIESHLRNAGHPLRVTWVNTLEDVEDWIRRAPPDLILADKDVRAAPRDRVLESVRRLQPDLPVLLLSRSPTLEATVLAISSGAQDLVSYEDATQLRHLELVVVREFLKHQQLRRLRTTEARLADFESRHSQLTDCTADAVGVVQEGILARANVAFARLLGYDDPAPLAGQPLIDLVEATQQLKIKERLRAVLKGKHVGELLELRLVGRTGPVEVKAQLILGNQDGERVIELLIRAAGPVDAVIDPPACAPSARAGRTDLARALATPNLSTGTTRSALLLRIDDFAGLEDRVGHADAETLTAQVAASVQRQLGPLDQLFPFSTDELALLVCRPDAGDVEKLAESLRKALRDEIYTLDDHESQVSLSIAVFHLGAADGAQAVIRQLVTEARSASCKGGNRVVLLGSTARATQNVREEARLAAQTRRAIAEDRLKLAYQSIASLEGEARSHYDVLVRMFDDAGREWTASEFLPAAQKFNLMRSVDRWVVGTVIDIILSRKPNAEASVLFVKLSEDTLRDSEAFIVWLRTVLNGRRLKADEIVFEAQELVLQNHIRKAKALTRELADLGAGIAIEHFGIGSNSIQMLDHIPAQFLKFHASFTHAFGEKDSQRRLVELVEAAKIRNIKTIVSHVEDANVMARLWQMGVNFIQGYHVQEPEVVLLSGDFVQRR